MCRARPAVHLTRIDRPARALSGNDVLSCLVCSDPDSGHHWGKLFPTLIMSVFGGLADNQAGRDLSPFGHKQPEHDLALAGRTTCSVQARALFIP